MFVVKRDGHREPVQFEKITARIRQLCHNLPHCDPVLVARKVCSGVFEGVTTTQLDELAAETAAHLSDQHPDYDKLAARLLISNHHKQTADDFMIVARDLFNNQDKQANPAPLLSLPVMMFIRENQPALQAALNYDRDFNYTYFGFRTLLRSYLLKVDGRVVERPQHLLMRVACGIHCGNLDRVLESYQLMSNMWFTHASPTLFNAGHPRPQLSSCFLLTMTEDSIDGIYETLTRCAKISRFAGGIGLSCHKVRATGSYIRSTGGTSNGLVPMLRVFNNTARYVDQGGGKRKGAFAIYLEPWHADIYAVLELRRNTGAEEKRARDLFYGLWVPDLFMERVEHDEDWSLFCPNECPGLADVWGEDFRFKYLRYESRGKARQVVKARHLWSVILESQQETGTPYILYKDACNRKSNQKNLGTIRSSNLCTEIVEYTAPDEVAVCNLASLSLPRFVMDGKFNHQKLFEVTGVVARNLNRVIDVNYYPVPEARKSNLRHRPIGIGVQGLADVFMLLRLPFESDGARKLNREIFETIYFAAMTTSKNLAREHGESYSSYVGSPISQGQFQFDLWGVTPSARWDWAGLRAEIKQHGVRNSLMVAPMPTASTSSIMGNNECFEPYTSNLYLRRTLAGEFVMVNRHLLKDLIERKLWTPELKDALVEANGSVQNLPIPDELKQLYKTVWEIRGKHIIQMAADRGPFIDQSQSLNAVRFFLCVFFIVVIVVSHDLFLFSLSQHLVDVTHRKLTSMHFFAWKSGLKTGMYYLRTKAAVDAVKFTVCSRNNPDCTSCSG